VKVGDTITHVETPCKEAIAGFEEVKPMVFAGLYPVDASKFEELRSTLEKFQLNDASFVYEPESSLALGFGFRCGFLGLLHMEIVQERLRREFNLDIISTSPGVVYKLKLKNGEERDLDNPLQMPDPSALESIAEPTLKARIITPSASIGDVMRIVMDRRGPVEGTETMDARRVMLHCMLPLNEILIDFHDTLKSVSHGYASMDYEPSGYQVSDIVRMDILLNGETVDAFATMVHRAKARARGIQMCKALADTIPPHQFKIPVQAAIGREIIAREDIRPFRKDVLAKLYGGDVTRKMKVLEKQKRGKARMKEFGHVNVPQSAFIAVLKGTIKEK
jgi:GTP-binding protein LepA